MKSKKLSMQKTHLFQIVCCFLLLNCFQLKGASHHKDSLRIEALLAIDSDEYTSLKERRKFYKIADKLFTRYGYEVRWMAVANSTVRLLELAHSKIGGFFAHTNAEIRRFFNEGNKAILDDVLVKLRALWRTGEILKGADAFNWDAQMLSDEQNLIDPFYERMTSDSQQILDDNLKRWISTAIFRNPKFEGHVLDQKARWLFGMTKMKYNVDKDMMPIPEGNWKKLTLKEL